MSGGFLMNRMGVNFGGGSICWKRRPDGTHCCMGAFHPGDCPPMVNREAYDRVVRMTGWDEASGTFREDLVQAS